MRYLGQAITIPVDIDLSQLQLDAPAHISDLFEKAHKKAFTYKLSSDIELMNLRIVAEEVPPQFQVQRLAAAETEEPHPSAIIARTTLVYQNIEYTESPIWIRTQLKCGHIVQGRARIYHNLQRFKLAHLGPCVVNEMDSNTLILPGFQAQVDEIGNLLIWESEKSKNVAQEKSEAQDEGLDTVTVDIFESALRNARNEMDTLMTRASMSPAIREQQVSPYPFLTRIAFLTSLFKDEFNVIAEPR